MDPTPLNSPRKTPFWKPALAVLVPLGFLPFCFSACADREGYPDDLEYPLRADLLVDEVPKLTPNNPPVPGAFDKSVADLALVGGKVLNPATAPAELKTELAQVLLDHFGTPSSPRVGNNEGKWGLRCERPRKARD